MPRAESHAPGVEVVERGGRPRLEQAERQVQQLGAMLAREVHDPGVGFVTLTRVHVIREHEWAKLEELLQREYPDLNLEVELEQAEAMRLVLADRFRKSLFHAARDLLGYPDITERTHRPTIDCLEDAGTRKLICVPRGTFKSSIGVVSYAVWCLIRNPNLRILIDSEIYENSKNFVREIRGKMESPEMHPDLQAAVDRLAVRRRQVPHERGDARKRGFYLAALLADRVVIG